MARFEASIGRYVHLDIGGITYRVYFEESGSGIPVLLQHTAGSDGRQWRHLLADAELTRDCRFIAYDLPYHGKSIPPLGVRWWESEYRLRQDFFLAFVLTLARALELERPVFMGCSMGGHLAADLALHHPDAFRAIIGVEAGLHSPGYHLDWWHHPRISNESKPAAMMSLMSPTSPEAFRRETAWFYSQGAPPVFKGDLYYYAVEHDLRESAHRIDTRRCPLYLLTGAYDWATTPEMSRALADAIPGARYQTMEGCGHFPMSENPEAFRGYLLPILTEIRDRTEATTLQAAQAPR